MFFIRINFPRAGMPSQTLDHIRPGQSLLEICLKNNIGLQHDCGGGCSCSTCQVYIEKGGEHLEEMSKREKDFLKKAFSPRPNSRLACQCLLISKKGEVELTIPDQSTI
jgi:2Fe-2S ferredoxin